MKTNITIISLIALGASLTGVLGSCTAEAPFAGEGEGAVKMHVVLNDKLSRADGDADMLAENCKIYITTGEGYSNVLHKWTGVDNLPASVALKYGVYCAEAYAGDSVPASWDKKYYKGLAPFEVSSSQPNPEVQIVCKIANVAVSVDKNSIDNNVIADDYTITFRIGNTNKTLVFGKTEVDSESKGYFMMPVNQTGLSYEIVAKDKEGNSHTYPGTIDNVKPAHEYRLSFKYGADASTAGGAFISIEIDDVELITDEIIIEGPPTVSGTDNQVVNLDGTFTDEVVSVASYGSLKSLQLTLPATASSRADATAAESVDVIHMSNYVKDDLARKGIDFDEVVDEATDVHLYHINFRAKWLNALPKSTEPITVPIVAIDQADNSVRQEFSVANTESAIVIKDPLVLNDISVSDCLAVTGTKAVVTLRVVTPEAGTPVLRYRAAGTGAWQDASGTLSGDIMTFNLSGLTTGTRYEYQATVGDFVSESKYFTTDEAFVIHNASFEDWSTYSAQTMLGKKDVTLPWSVGDKGASFWGSGNEGAATANMTLTNKSGDMFHSGSSSARLESKSALGLLAAGNIFVGEYVKTDGTNGVLSVGRPYNGSHPEKLKVWVNYRPGNKMKIEDKNAEFLPSGFKDGNDYGQIYVALTTGAIEIRTNPNNRKLFSKDDSEVLAYGQVTWTEAFGPDGALQEVEIPIEYNDRAKTTKPTHLVIVVSASKYGDYFSGSEGSVMYLDDFELVY